MKKVAVLLGAVLALLPSLMSLVDWRYRLDPALQGSVCPTVACSDQLLLDSADRLITGGDKQDTATALAMRQEALRRNSASPDRWSDLGEAFLAAGRIQEARYCFTRATALGPESPPTLWRTAQFYTQIHDTSRSQEYMGRLLSLMPQYRDLVFGTYVSSGATVVDTFEHGFPTGGLAQEYFGYLLTQDLSLEDSRRAWEWLKAHSLNDSRLAAEYVDWLSGKREYSLAHDVWKHSVGKFDHAYLNPNLVFNGSFESEPLQSGLDWRYSETPGARVMRDSAIAFSGASSLRIEFDGTTNLNFNAVTNDVVVSSGRYHFRAWVRTSELTTDQGIAFQLTDLSGRSTFGTMPLTGTHDWIPVDLDFALAGPARLIRISVVRRSSWKFDNKISGKAWIDGVSLVGS